MKEKYLAFKEWKKNPRHKALYQLMCWFAFFAIVYLVAISGLFSADYVSNTSSKEVKDSLENYLNMTSYEYEYDIVYDTSNIKVTGVVFKDKNYFEIGTSKYYYDGSLYLVDEVQKKLIEQKYTTLPLDLMEMDQDSIHKWLSEGTKYETIEYNDGEKEVTYLYTQDEYEIKIKTEESDNLINNLELDLTEFMLARGTTVTTFTVNIVYDNINNISSYDRHYDEYEIIDMDGSTIIEEAPNSNEQVVIEGEV